MEPLKDQPMTPRYTRPDRRRELVQSPIYVGKKRQIPFAELSMATKSSITFYYSIGSRYSYLACTQIEQLERDSGCEVDWVSVDGTELRALSSSEVFVGEAASGQYRSPYREQDLEDWARFYDVPYREPPSENGKIWWRGMDVSAFRLWARAAAAGKRLGSGAAYSRSLVDAIFASGVWPIDEAVCVDLAKEVGLSKSEFSTTLRDPRTETDVSAYSQQAHEAGAFGVPTFVYKGHMFWGNDRIVLLKHHIANDEGRPA